VLAVLGGTIVAEAATASVPTRVGDRRIALEIGLTTKDMGPGWVAAGTSRNPSSIDTGAAVSAGITTECGGSATTKTETDLVVTGGAISEFAQPGGTAVSLVMMLKTPSLAAEQVASTGDIRALKPCLASVLAKAFKAGGKTTLVSLEERPFPTPDQASDSLRIVLKLSSAGQSRRVYLDLTLQQDGRGLVEGVHVSVGKHPVSSLEHRLALISSKRLIRYAND
jgi:hypothetical protein